MEKINTNSTENKKHSLNTLIKAILASFALGAVSGSIIEKEKGKDKDVIYDDYTTSYEPENTYSYDSYTFQGKEVCAVDENGAEIAFDRDNDDQTIKIVDLETKDVKFITMKEMKEEVLKSMQK